MIRRFRVQNFMSLRDVTVDFGHLTIFIGPNASGKSAIFKALTALSRLLHGAAVRGPSGDFYLEPGVGFDTLVWQGNSGQPIVFQVWSENDPDEEPWYTVQITKQSAGWSVTQERIRLDTGWFDTSTDILEHQSERRGLKRWEAPNRALLSYLVHPYQNDQAALPDIAPFLEVPNRFGEAWRYRPSADDIASFAPPAVITRPEAGEKPQRIYVKENGAGLAQALEALLGSDRALFEQIEKELQRIFPHIRFINFDRGPLGTRIAFMTERSGEKVTAPQESDGVLLTLFLLWRLYTAGPSLKVCLEEPENGTHPYLLGERFRILRKFALGDTENKSPQLLVATHSPDFLAAVEDRAELLEMIRAVEFDKERGTMVNQLSDVDQIETLLNIFSGDLGELWWSGAIGAVPEVHDE